MDLDPAFVCLDVTHQGEEVVVGVVLVCELLQLREQADTHLVGQIFEIHDEVLRRYLCVGLQAEHVRQDVDVQFGDLLLLRLLQEEAHRLASELLVVGDHVVGANRGAVVLEVLDELRRHVRAHGGCVTAQGELVVDGEVHLLEHVRVQRDGLDRRGAHVLLAFSLRLLVVQILGVLLHEVEYSRMAWTPLVIVEAGTVALVEAVGGRVFDPVLERLQCVEPLQAPTESCVVFELCDGVLRRCGVHQRDHDGLIRKEVVEHPPVLDEGEEHGDAVLKTLVDLLEQHDGLLTLLWEHRRDEQVEVPLGGVFSARDAGTHETVVGGPDVVDARAFIPRDLGDDLGLADACLTDHADSSAVLFGLPGEQDLLPDLCDGSSWDVVLLGVVQLLVRVLFLPASCHAVNLSLL